MFLRPFFLIFDLQRPGPFFLVGPRAGGGNIRPAGHTRPAKANFLSIVMALLTEMWPARLKKKA